jgi:hypothetical protein
LAAAAVVGFVIGWTDLLPRNVGGGDTVDIADILDDDSGPLL